MKVHEPDKHGSILNRYSKTRTKPCDLEDVKQFCRSWASWALAGGGIDMRKKAPPFTW